MKKVIYLDNAASSFPKPLEVAKAMTRAINVFGANPGRSGHFLSMYAAEEVYLCRQLMGELFNAQPENVVFTPNATFAINLVLKGILSAGSHAIISDLEHNAVTRPLKALDSLGITYSEAKVDFDNDENTVKAFENLILPNTKMLACTHASNVCGKILPIKKLGELAKKRGLLFLVDGAQTGGSIQIDVKENHIDYLCLAGHKGLYGPQGTGVLLLNNPLKLDTLVEGGTGVNSEELIQPLETPERYESGTINTPGIVGLKEGLKFIKKVGTENIKKYENTLLLYAYESLFDMKGVKLYTKPDESYAAVLPMNVDGFHSNELAAFLDENLIMTRSGYHCAPTAHRRIGTIGQGAVRLSFGLFNTKGHIDQLAFLIKKFTKNK